MTRPPVAPDAEGDDSSHDGSASDAPAASESWGRAEDAALIDAAALGHLIEVQRILASGEADVDARDEDQGGSTALVLASQNGRPMVVDALLAAGADVNACNAGGDTPLILASLNGHGAIVDALLRAGANVHATDQFGSCALFYASRQGHCGLLDALIDRGADVNGSRVTALLIASRFGHASAVNKLLLAGADVSAVDDDKNTALHRTALETTPGAVYGGGTGEVVELLIKNCARMDVVNNDGLTPMQLALKGLNRPNEWQRRRCREVVDVLEAAKNMSLGLRRWIHAAGLECQWREFARLGAKYMDDIHMLERDDAKREKGSSLTPIQANRLFRAVSNSVNLIQSDYEGGAGVLTGGGVRENRGEGDQGGEGGDGAEGAEDDDDGDWLKMGKRFEQFLLDHKLEDYADHFSMLGCAFERDLLDITDAQLSLMVERHGLKVLDRRRFAKALVGLRRRLLDGERSDGHNSPGCSAANGVEERHPHPPTKRTPASSEATPGPGPVGPGGPTKSGAAKAATAATERGGGGDGHGDGRGMVGTEMGPPMSRSPAQVD